MENYITTNFEEVKKKLNNDADFNALLNDINESFNGVVFKVRAYGPKLNGNSYTELAADAYSVDSTFIRFFWDFIQTVYKDNGYHNFNDYPDYKGKYIDENTVVNLINNLLIVLTSLIPLKEGLLNIIKNKPDEYKNVEISKDEFFIFSMEKAPAIAFAFTFYVNERPYQIGLRYLSLRDVLKGKNNESNLDAHISIVLHKANSTGHSWDASSDDTYTLSTITKNALEQTFTNFMEYIRED